MAITNMQFGQSAINVVLNEGQLPAKLSTDVNGNTVLVGGDGVEYMVGAAYARMNCDAVPTSIPNSASGAGTYNTKLAMYSIVKDVLGTVADLANSQFIIPAGYKSCRIGYAVAFGTPPAWAANTAYALNAQRIPTAANGYFYRATTAGTSHATTEPTWPTTVGATVADGTVTWTCHSASEGVGWRGCRIKDENGKNYGNQRISAVSSDATTKSIYTTPWLEIVPAYSPTNAPNKIHVGAQMAVYPAQTSGDTLDAGVDLASSWFHIEFKS